MEHHPEEIDEVIASLPKERGFLAPNLCLYQNFWFPVTVLPNVITFQRHFRAKDNDIVLASQPKAGTTWLKALVFSIVNRRYCDISNTPLLTSNPHELVPFLEFTLYANNTKPNLEDFPEPRIFSTHLPYSCLPESVKRSNCRIVYICRNPLDTVVSSWHFFKSPVRSENQPERSMEEHFETFCDGKTGFGPFWDQTVGYWKESLEEPHKVLFLKCEDLTENVVAQVKKVAEFVGLPFSTGEEEAGVIQGIAETCSLRKLKDLEVNKSGKFMPNFENRSYFRKGEVGDWANSFSPPMVARLHSIMEEKMSPFGLEFKTR
ncbi:cytosolic sulfotransferase 15-like [Rhodamnia argentea]|uniref:Sulfotransferase n=1 Tax=Rhodamnia argentea TaxID=178133 RepID=A0ABM3HUL7_9MYRT|nr:cytosolic sulfotransferase 15-like [Rhodamnia argentea]